VRKLRDTAERVQHRDTRIAHEREQIPVAADDLDRAIESLGERGDDVLRLALRR